MNRAKSLFDFSSQRLIMLGMSVFAALLVIAMVFINMNIIATDQVLRVVLSLFIVLFVPWIANVSFNLGQMKVANEVVDAAKKIRTFPANASLEEILGGGNSNVILPFDAGTETLEGLLPEIPTKE